MPKLLSNTYDLAGRIPGGVPCVNHARGCYDKGIVNRFFAAASEQYPEVHGPNSRRQPGYHVVIETDCGLLFELWWLGYDAGDMSLSSHTQRLSRTEVDALYARREPIPLLTVDGIEMRAEPCDDAKRPSYMIVFRDALTSAVLADTRRRPKKKRPRTEALGLKCVMI